MSETTHTPGPWEIGDDCGTGQLIVTYQAADVCAVEPGRRANANARLIAAAPDLLAACNALLQCQCYDVPLGECCPCRAAAEAAINKATGA